MKKSVKFLGVLFTSLLLFGLTACKNWMTGDLFSSIEKEIEVASAENKNVYVRYADTSFGEINAKSDYAKYDEKEKTFPAKIGHQFTVSATPGTSYAFVKWAAFSSLDVNPKKNLTSLIYDSFDKDYENSYLLKELPAEIVGFNNVEISEDGESATASCTVLVPLDDEEALNKANLGQYYNKDARIYVMPVVAKRAELSRYTYPRNESETVYVRNQRVALAFKKAMDFSSFVQLKEEFKEFTDQGVFSRVLEDGTKEYFYDWDRDLIKIVVNDSNGNPVDEDVAYSYFQLPEPDSDDPKKIIISPNLENKLPKYAEIIFTISKYVKDSDGFYLTTAIEYTYSVGQFEDNGAPTFILLSGGVPDVADEDNLVDKKERENSWSDFNGYADKDGSVTNRIPDDSTNVDDWNNDEINKPFSNRIRNSIDMLVKIVDQIKPGELNNNATDQDIKSFAVRAKHLVNADGTPGTGRIYKTAEEYNFDSLRYSNGSKGFEIDEPGNKYKTPEDGYAFPFYLPEDIPDGLIKIEVYAVDVTGNSGELEPFAMYVVKDTQPPALEKQADRIISASTNTLTNWFNATTIQKLAFKIDPANPIVDTTIIENEVRNVHSKFMTSDAKLYWKFGSSEDQMGGFQEIDMTGNNSYDMSQLISAIKDQGAMTFYSQIRDNQGNKSSATQIPLKIYFDTVEPEEAEILAPGEGSKIYPYASGVEGGSKGTYYTKDSELKLSLKATDSGFAGTTETSSGVAGFLVPQTEYTTEALVEALTIEDGKLKDMIPAADGKVEQTFAAGETPNNSKQDHFIYTVDNALNASKSYTKISVIQDTTGPGIILSDKASYSYNKNTNLYKAKADLEEWDCVPGEKGSVKGISKGNYYYNGSETDFPFAVTLKNECGEFDSGAFMFSVRRNNKDGAEVTSGATLGDISLSEGTYCIVAYDNLGNETVSPVFTVVQDSSVPVLNSSTFKIHGRKFGLSEYNTVTTNYRTVHLSFDAKDIDGKNTGIRKFILKGASFKGSSSAPVIVRAGDTTLVAGTDYFIEAAKDEEEESYIVFIEPRLETSFRIENAVLPSSDGTKIVTLAVTDAVGNTCSQIETSIFADTNAPVITSVCDIALATSIDGTDDNVTATNDDKVNVQISAYDAISGLRKIYIVDAVSEVDVDNHDAPAGTSLLTAESKLFVDGVEVQGTVAAGNAYFELTNPSISTTDLLYTVTNVNLPELSRQGVQTIHVVVYDDTGLRPQSSVSDSIIYDTTGPAVKFTDYAAYKYNGNTLEKYRKNDKANDVAAVTGSTGTVNGLVSGEYYYSNSESYFRFKVEIEDQNVTNNTVISGGIVSGEYKFFIDNNENVFYDSGDEILLSEGNHTVTALDKLGNRTVSPVIKVVQDTAAPLVSDIVIHGKEADGITETTAATISDTVYVTFKVDDTESRNPSNSGVRKVYLKGADFSDFTLKANETSFAENIDYYVTTENEFTVITFAVPETTETTYTVSNVKLTGDDGTKTISVYVSDSVLNNSTEISNSIYFDGSAPEVRSVTIVSPDESFIDADKEMATRSTKVSVRLNVYELISGIRRVYINKEAADSQSRSSFPVSETLLSGDSKVLSKSGVVLGAYDSSLGAIIFASPYTTPAEDDQTLVITNVNLPEMDRQGTQTIYVSVYDDSGLRNQVASSDSIIFDTTGPAVDVIDYAAYRLSNSSIKKYRSSDNEKAVSAVTGNTGRINGLTGDSSSFGVYYYNKDEEGFTFKINLTDENITNNVIDENGSVSGEYKFYIDSEESELLENGSVICLSAGDHTITAYDSLKNKTIITPIKVVQDTSLPSISNLVITGTEADGTTASSIATTSSEVKVTFNVNDTVAVSNVNTGIRRISLKGADFSEIIVKTIAGTLVKGSDYFVSVDGDYTVLTLAEVDKNETAYTIEKVKLTGSEGTKTISANVTDGTGNKCLNDVSYSIFFDETAPAVNEVTMVSADSDASDPSSETSTKSEQLSVRIKTWDSISGIKRIYINSGAADSTSKFSVPSDATLLTSTSKAKLGDTVIGSYDAAVGAIVMNTPEICSESEALVLVISDVKIPDPSTEGTQTIYVSVYDNSGLRNKAATSDSIIYDITGPKISVTDQASYVYVNDSKFYRTNDTADDIEKVRGVTGSVNGLVTGTYWYNNISEGFEFKVDLSDENNPNSGEWDYKVTKNGTVVEGLGNKLSGSTFILSEGEYVFTARDNLGNKTSTNTVKVKQDKLAPVVTDFTLYENEDNPAELDKNSIGVYSTNHEKISATFTIRDSGTGVRKITLEGNGNTDYTNAALYADGTLFDETVGTRSGNTFIFKEPLTPNENHSIRVTGIVPAEGQYTLGATAEDAAKNGTSFDAATDSGSTAFLYKDSVTPAVTSVRFEKADESEEKYFGTQTAPEGTTLKIRFTEQLSGLRRIYIKEDGVENPFAGTGFQVSVTYADGTDTVLETIPQTDSSYIELKNTNYPVSAEPMVLTLKNVKVSDTSAFGEAEGTKNIYVHLSDAAANGENDTVTTANNSYIYDVSGPAVDVDDHSSYEYNAQALRYRTTDTEETKAATATNNAVTGLIASSETYYYGGAETGVPFTFTVTDDEGSGCRTGYSFTVTSGSTTYTEADAQVVTAAQGSSAWKITLPEGNWTFKARDYLGNETVSPVINVKQDTASSYVTGYKLYSDDECLHELDSNSTGVYSTNSSTVSALFVVKDIDTGVRKITLEGNGNTDYAGAVLYADGNLFDETTGTRIGNTFIFKEPLTPNENHSIRVTGIVPAEGEYTLGATAEDAAKNGTSFDASTDSGSTAFLYKDSVTPEVVSVRFEKADESEEKYFGTQVAPEGTTLKISFREQLSGLRRIYIKEDGVENPFAGTGFQVSVTYANGTETVLETIPQTDSSYIELKNTNYPVSGEPMVLTLKNVKVSDTSAFGEAEGTKNIYVHLSDAAANGENDTVTTANNSYIYDVSGPAVDVDDHSSYEYNAQALRYRTTDEEVTKAATATNNAVTGLIASSETYYYGSAETGVPFTFTVKDDEGSGCRTGYSFTVTSGSTTYTDEDAEAVSAGQGSAAWTITLPEGAWTLTARDYLGNETVSPVINVKQDAASSYVTGYKLYSDDECLHELDSNSTGVYSTNSSTVSALFVVKDVDTGVRKITLEGNGNTDYAGAALYADGNLFDETTGTRIGNTFIFKEPLTPNENHSIKVTGIVPAEGQYTLGATAEDAAKNGTSFDAATDSGSTAFLYKDSVTPEVVSVRFEKADESEEKYFGTQTAPEGTTLKIRFTEQLSGLRRIYIKEDGVENPFAGTGFQVSVTYANGTSKVLETIPQTDNSYIELKNTNYPVSAEPMVLTLKNVKVSDTSVFGEAEGTKNIYVHLSDAAANGENDTVTTANNSYIYDVSGPAVDVDDHSSYEYNAQALRYRTTDTEETKAATATNNAVTGLIAASETYYYGGAETGVPFTFTVTDDEGSGCRTGYSFTVTSGSTTYTEADAQVVTAAQGSSAWTITLPEGAWTFTARDYLGNETVSPVINVKQDTASVLVTNFVMHGKNALNYDVESTASNPTGIARDDVYFTFDIADDNVDEKPSTGVRELNFAGNGLFSEEAVISRKTADEADSAYVVLEKDTDYTISSDGTKVCLKYPDVENHTYKITGIKLSDIDGTATELTQEYFVSPKDAAGNTDDYNVLVIRDTTPPVVSDVIAIADAEDKDKNHEDSLNNVTKHQTVTLEFKAHDIASGLKRVYVNKALTKASNNTPLSQNLLTTTGENVSKLLVADSEGIFTEVAGAVLSEGVLGTSFILDEAREATAAPETFRITNVKLPFEEDDSVIETRHYFYVVCYDEVMVRDLEDEAVPVTSIVYDNTAPVPVVNMHAPSHFNPYEAYRGVHGNEPQYFVNNAYWKKINDYYFELTGDDTNGLNSDEVAGFWKGTYKEGSGTEKEVSGLQKVTSTSSETTYNFYVYDAVENKSIPSAETNTIVTVKKDTSAPILTFDGYYANGTKLEKDAGLSYTSNTNSATHYYYTNTDTVDLKFKAHDTGVGILYFDVSGTINASFKNGRFTETDSNAKIAEFLSKSTGLQLWIDGVQYYRGGYDRTTGKYSDGPDGYGDRAYWNEETQKWYMDSAKTQETQNVYFNCYKDLEAGQDDGIRGFRDFALYNSIPASSTDSVFELRNIDLSCLEQSYMQFNIYVYDHMGNNSGIEYKRLIYDTNKPKIVKTSFVSSGDVNFTSSDALSTHDLVVEFKENYSNTSSYSGIKEIELELSSNVPSSIDSTLNMGGFSSTEPEDSFKVYLTGSAPTALDSTKYEITSSYKAVVSSVDAVNHIAKLKITLQPTSTGSSSSGYHYYSYASGTASRYLVIHGLTIAGGDADQIETIKVTLKDRAGNVSDNTGNTNNVVEIGYDKTAPIMYPVYGNEVIDGKLARSYFKTVFGKPTVLSLHHATSNTDPTKIHNNSSIADNMVFNIFPEPGDVIQNYGDGIDCPAPYSGTAWEDNADLTELVLRFNKNGSGVKSIKLAAEGNSVDSWDFRRILFNPSKVKVSIDEGQHWYSPGSSALPYTVTSDTLTFTNSGICPKGENCSVMIKGVMPNFKATYCRHNGDGDYRENIWWSDVIVTSFAGKANHYSYYLALADDVDTPELTRKKISVTDTSSTDTSFTDGETIQIMGRIQSKSTHKVYSSGLWAIQLSGAEFDLSAIPSFKAYVSKPTGDYGRKLLLPNSVSYEDGDPITYSYDSTNDYSVRRTVDELTTISKVDANPSQFKFSISSDRTTLYLNMPLDIDDTKDFTLSGIKLPSDVLDGNHDGAQNISLKLIKYSGLTNDPDDRYWDYDESNERDESYKTMFREVGAYYSATEEHRGAVNFAQNRTNSITLDTVPPVITWKLPSTSSPNDYQFYPTDATGHTVYYKDNSALVLNFSFTDTSGIKGYYFTDSATDAADTPSKYTYTSTTYAVTGFNSSTDGGQSVKYIHVMDKAGNITTRPVTYLPAETETPTTWILDKTSPKLVTGAVLHYWGDADEKKYVMTSSSSDMTVYTNESKPTQGYFTDSLVEGETGGLETFVTETGSGIYGTASDYYLNKIYKDEDGNPDFRWVTGNSNFTVMDNVGGFISRFSITQKIDSGKPELSFYSIYSNKGGNSFWPKSGITLSTNQDNPTVLYLGGTADEDYIRLVLNAKDTGTNATGIYKVTANGTELSVGTTYDNTVSHLSERTEFSTTEKTVTWLLGQGESKTEGEANGLLRSITITDWVGNETTYWFKLVSDVSEPTLDLSENGPFEAHTYSAASPYNITNQTGKVVVFFSPSTWTSGNTTATTTVNLSTVNLTDVSGLTAGGKWYSDEACSTAVTKVSFTQKRTYSNRAYVYSTPTAEPPVIYTKDNVGNVLAVTFVGKTVDDIEDSTADEKVVFCYASANTAAVVNLKANQVVSDGTGYAESGSTVGLSSGTPKIVYIKNSSTTIEFAPDDYNGLSYQYKKGDEDYNTAVRFRNTSRTASINMDAGSTYTVKLLSTKAPAIYTEYQIKIVQDSSAPEISYVSNTASNGLTYPASVVPGTSELSPAVLYLKGIGKNDYHSIILKAKDTGVVGVKSVEASGTGIVKVTTGDNQTVSYGSATANTEDEMEITFRLGSGENKQEGDDKGIVRSLVVTDWVGNSATYWFKLVSDNTVPAYTPADYDVLPSHSYSVADEPSPYLISSNNAVYIRDTATVNLPSLTDSITGVYGDGWTIESGSGASISGGDLTVTEAGTVTLSYKDNVGNTVTKDISVMKIETAPALALADSESIGTDDYSESTWGSGDYIIYTKASDGKARLKLKCKNIISNFTSYSYAGTGSVSSVTGTVSDDAAIELPAGTYKFQATDLFNQKSEYTVTVITDTEGPLVVSNIMENPSYTDGDDFYSTGASNVEKTSYTFYTKGTDSVSISLSAQTDNGSGFRGWSESDSVYSEITSVILPAGNSSVKTIYMWDNTGNTTPVTFTGIKCDSVTLSVVPATGTGIYYDTENDTVYTNLASVNADVSATGASALTYSATPNVADGKVTLASGDEGVAVNYTISVSDVVGNTASKTLHVVKDTTKPNPDSLVFTITKNAINSDGTEDSSIKTYFDAESWKLYYNKTTKIYPFFTITGITDGANGSGPARIGLNSTSEKPGWNFIEVVDGTAINVWGSFTGTQEKALYISDKVGNGDANGDYFKIIHGESDTTPPDSVSITGDSAVFFKKNDGTYVSNGLGTFTGTDSQSGFASVDVSGNKIVATDNVGNTKEFGVVESSLGKASSITYTTDENRDGAIAVEPDSYWTDTWAHRYVFTVSGYSSISKIYVLGIDSEQFGCAKLVVGNNQVTGSIKSRSEYGTKRMAEIEVTNANGLSGDVEVRLYSGYGNCASPDDLQIMVTGTKAAALNLSFVSRIGTAMAKTGTSLSSAVVKTVRQIFIPENRDVAAGSKKSVVPSVKNSRTELASETVTSVATKTSDVTVKKAKQDLEKRAAEIESSGRFGKAVDRFVEDSVTAVEKLVEETVNAENAEIQPEMNISENVVKQENFVAKTADNGYNRDNIAKSVFIIIVSVLFLLCSIFVIIQYNKRRTK